MELKYTDNVQAWTRKLRTAGFAMQEAAAQACTFAARAIAAQYKTKLRTEIVMMRNEKFTLKSFVVYPARHIRKSTGQLRQMSDINSIVGVKKIGSKDHYLKMLEIGADKHSAGQIGGVPIPLDSARGGSRRAVVSGDMRLDRGSRYGGAVDISRFASNPRQQFAIISNMARRGKLKKGSYYAVDHGTKKWLYKINADSVTITRDISEDIVKIKENPMFERSVETLSSADMETYFSRAALILMSSLN